MVELFTTNKNFYGTTNVPTPVLTNEDDFE
jgi:hypothetical protein